MSNLLQLSLKLMLSGNISPVNWSTTVIQNKCQSFISEAQKNPPTMQKTQMHIFSWIHQYSFCFVFSISANFLFECFQLNRTSPRVVPRLSPCLPGKSSERASGGPGRRRARRWDRPLRDPDRDKQRPVLPVCPLRATPSPPCSWSTGEEINDSGAID